MRYYEDKEEPKDMRNTTLAKKSYKILAKY